MWRSRLFWKLFLAYAGLNLLAAVAFVVIVSRGQEERIVSQVRDRLHDTAVVMRSRVSDLFDPQRRAELQALVRQLGAETEVRMTVVALDGQVLADSEKETLADVDRMDNHAGRPELVHARDTPGGRGTAERESPSLSVWMHYFALRVDGPDGEAIGMVRTAIRMASIREEVAKIRRLIWAIAGIVSLVVLGLTYVVVLRMVRPVATLTEAAEAVAAGDYQRTVEVARRDELGMLAGSFDRMRRELTSRLSDLRAGTQRFSTVLGGMTEGVVAIDRNGDVLLANSAAARLLGVTSETVQGKLFRDVNEFAPLRQMIIDVLDSPAPRSLSVAQSGATDRILGVNATPLPGEPCPGVVLVLHDETELRRLEMMRQEFVANVSHELKTPLSSIKAYAETLSLGALDDPANNRRFVQRIEEQADRLHQLIIDLLRLARIESGQQAFEIESVPLAEVVEACLTDHRDAAAAKQIHLECENVDSSVHVRADEEGLRQILDNLVDNAIKYTPDGGRVLVRWTPGPKNVRIELDDNGIGIPAEYQSRLFERFFRVDKARSRELGGTGLGLSIVKHLAQSFGGGVGVESEPGRGSTFYVELPVAPAIPCGESSTDSSRSLPTAGQVAP